MLEQFNRNSRLSRVKSRRRRIGGKVKTTVHWVWFGLEGSVDAVIIRVNLATKGTNYKNSLIEIAG
jgi:hypothetical protein